MNVQQMNEKELQQLQKEIKQRQLALTEEKQQKEIEQQKVLIQRLIDSNLLELIPHLRSTCSDDNPVNGYVSGDDRARCPKCHLLEIVEDHEMDIHDFSISLHFDIERIDKIT